MEQIIPDYKRLFPESYMDASVISCLEKTRDERQDDVAQRTIIWQNLSHRVKNVRPHSARQLQHIYLNKALI